MRLGFCAALLLLALGVGWARAQSSLEMLQRDLDEMKSEHQETTTKNFAAFTSALQAASQSPDAAEALYLKAGGIAPKAADVRTEYEHETPSEASARQAVDREAQGAFGGLLQLHCALMRFGAIFVSQPQTAGLQESWLAWLKTAAAAYPQVAVTVVDPRGADDGTGEDSGRHSRHHAPTPPPEYHGPDLLAQLKTLTLSGSPISSYFGFRGWAKSDQGKWSVSQLPEFYQDQVLKPLRAKPSADTLAAWDVYMAMRNADQPDAKQWADIDYPTLLFEKDCDDFASAPSTDKLQTLIGIIKEHPDHPDQDEWLARMHGMVQAYRAQRNGSAPAAVAAPPPLAPDSASSAPITATTVVPPATNSARVQ